MKFPALAILRPGGARTPRGVERARVAVHMPLVGISKLFAILIAAAMLFAPFAMQSGAAMAVMPSDRHAQMMGEGDCEGQPAGDTDGKSNEMPGCAAMCAAIAAAPVSPGQPAALTRSIERPALEPSLHGFLAKLPTPPPRRA